MPQFRSRPVIIEATQWFTHGDHPAVYFATDGGWMVDGAQGSSRVDDGDWIIKEPLGDGYYPCKPAVFDAKYDAV
jgi:hypothetical protein